MKTRIYAVDPLTLIVVALLVMKAPSGGPGKKHFWEFWKPNPVEQVQRTQAELDAERAKQEQLVAKAKADSEAAMAKARADVEAENRKQLGVSQEASIATVAAIEAAQAKTAAGSLPVKELETAHTVAKTTRDGLDQALGPASPQRVRELELMVMQLNTGVAAGAEALKAMQGALDASVRREGELKAAQAAIEAKAKSDVAAAEATAKAAIDEKDQANRIAASKEQTWALERDALARRYENAVFYAELAAVAVALALGVVLWLRFKVGKLGNFGHDATALIENLKQRAAKTPDELAALEREISADWMTMHDGTAKLFHQAKEALRL